MTKEKLAIVSSYDDFCGNASYTKALEKGLLKYYDVTVVSLNIDLLRNGDKKSGNLHIKNICEQLKAFDCVNIQFEAGLLGSNPSMVQKRFFCIAKACKRLMVTMHRYHAKEEYPGLVYFGKILFKAKIKTFFHALKSTYARNRYVPVYNKIINFCKKRNCPILVHTKRDRELILIKFRYDHVYDHPLCFYDQDLVNTFGAKHNRKTFCENLRLDETNVYIGVFGFISKYKGYETAIKALEFLPENYHLLIFGAQHPHTIKIEEPINDYINKLLAFIENLKLTHRVKFFHLLKDEDFLSALLGCDFNILPYLEVNQGGSAIAALSLETNSKTVFSQTLAFFELAKYAPNSFKMFSIGNYMELANAILSYNSSNYSENLKNYHNKYNIHTSSALYQQLLSQNR